MEQIEAERRRAAKWRARHPEKAKAASKRSYWKHRAKKIAEMREYERINRAKILAGAQKYRDTYPKRVRASNQKWYRAHKDDELKRFDNQVVDATVHRPKQRYVITIRATL